MKTAALGLTLSAPKVEPWTCAEVGVPPLFVSGCVGNVALARQKWEQARQWRQRFDIDKVGTPAQTEPSSLTLDRPDFQERYALCRF